MLTNYKPGYIRSNGMKIAVNRGQLGWSEIRLSERWKWSRGKVRRFLSELESEQMIVQQKDRRKSLITICNYDEFQGAEQPDDTTDSTTDGQETDKKRDTIKKLKKEKNDNKGKEKPPTPAVDFSVFNASDEQISEMKRIRKLGKGGALSQRVVNSLAKEFDKAAQMGYSFDDCLTEWESGTWKSMKADWVHNRLGGSNGQHRQPSDKAQTRQTVTASVMDVHNIDWI
jgi:hypothetical protein